MATAFTDKIEELITCPICFEKYIKPKNLPCLHTTCATCLSQYITSVFKTCNTKKDKPKAFPCPICRLDVPISDPWISPEDIVSKLPGNHEIVTLLDQRRLKSKDKTCDPCSVLEKHNTAVSWCTVCNEALCPNCDNCHRAMKMTQNHKICPLQEMRSESKSLTNLEFCTQHEDKRIEIYCMDHEQPCCAICITVQHRKCEHVKTLSDAAKGIRESPEIKELAESLKTMISELSNVLEGRKLNFQQLGKEKHHYQDKITRMRQDINKHLDLLEERVNQELDGRYKESSTLIENDIAEIESNLKVMNNCQKVLETGKENVSDINLFLEMNKIKQQRHKHSEFLKKRLEKMKNYEIKIRFEDPWANLISNMTKVGTVSSMVTPLDFKPGSLGRKINKSLRQNCVAKPVYSFKVGSCLTDGIFLQNDQMLMVDYNRGTVIFCTLEGHVNKKLSLSGRPCGIVQLDDREAAVVLHYTQNIQYIDIVNCKLGKLITVNKKLSYAIGYNGTNLIVGGTCGNLYMIKRSGKIIKTISSGCWYVDYITCSVGKIFLTSNGQMACLDMKGSKIFNYNTNSNLSCGQGISVDKDGNIYCCDHDSNNIHQLTPDGQFIKLIVTDIRDPRGIAFDKTGERFLVTHGNYVTVYELGRDTN